MKTITTARVRKNRIYNERVRRWASLGALALIVLFALGLVVTQISTGGIWAAENKGGKPPKQARMGRAPRRYASLRIPISYTLQRAAVMQYVYTNRIPMKELEEPSYDSRIWGIVLTNGNVLTVTVEPVPEVMNLQRYNMWSTQTNPDIPGLDLTNYYPAVIPNPETVSYLERSDARSWEIGMRPLITNRSLTLDLGLFADVVSVDQMLDLQSRYACQSFGAQYNYYPYHEVLYFPQVNKMYLWIPRDDDPKSGSFRVEPNALTMIALENFPETATYDVLSALQSSNRYVVDGPRFASPPYYRTIVFTDPYVKYSWSQTNSLWVRAK